MSGETGEVSEGITAAVSAMKEVQMLEWMFGHFGSGDIFQCISELFWFKC